MKRPTLKPVLIRVLEKYSAAVENFMLKMEEQEVEKAKQNHKANSFKQGLIEGYNKGYTIMNNTPNVTRGEILALPYTAVVDLPEEEGFDNATLVYFKGDLVGAIEDSGYLTLREKPTDSSEEFKSYIKNSRSCY